MYDSFVSRSLANTNKIDGLPTREHATYNCPCDKHDVRKSKEQTLTYYKRECQFNRKLNSFEINWHVCGNHLNAWQQNISLRNLPFKTEPSMIFFFNFSMTNCVPLQSRDGFKFRSKITVDPTFSRSRCGGMPRKSSEFKISVG